MKEIIKAAKQKVMKGRNGGGNGFLWEKYLREIFVC